MKKSIAFLGALLFGSVTFGQVTKNDTIKKPTSRKVSSEDLKKFPEDTQIDSEAGHIKGELSSARDGKKEDFRKITFKASSSESKSTFEKHSPFEKQAVLEKHTNDASAGTSSKIKGSVTQKGRSNTSGTVTEKQHYTIKMTNANSKTQSDITEKMGSTDSEATTQKKHVSNIKWSGEKVAADTTSNPTSAKSSMFMKITDVKGE